MSKPDRYSDIAAKVYGDVVTSGLPERVIAEALRTVAEEARREAFEEAARIAAWRDGGGVLRSCSWRCREKIMDRADEISGNNERSQS